jgi:YfiH family protein
MITPHVLEHDFGERVRAFSTMRMVGFSKGQYATFNVNPFCGDDSDAVAGNKRLLCSTLGIKEQCLIIPHQTHETNSLCIDADFLSQSDEKQASLLEGVDAVMTDLEGVCVSVSTADCVPVLLYDTEHHAVAAVHAGWRGTVARIVSKALLTMIRKYGTDASCVRAVIGPSISVDAFEVGDEVFQAFADAKFPMETIALRYPASSGAGEKWHLDLWEANRHLLLEAGVPNEHIKVSGICTYRQCEQFFSARRLGIKSGRILNGVMIKK